MRRVVILCLTAGFGAGVGVDASARQLKGMRTPANGRVPGFCGSRSSPDDRARRTTGRSSSIRRASTPLRPGWTSSSVLRALSGEAALRRFLTLTPADPARQSNGRGGP